MYDIEKIKDDVKKHMSEYRYNHSILVAQSACSLAKYYNLDYDKAYLAGIVHDIAKEFSDDENNYYIKKYKIDNKYLTDDLKPVLHGIVGSYYLKEKYNMDDEICNSVKFHTLGNPRMTMFDKIILVSDKIGRDNPDEELISLSYKNIDSAITYIFEKLEKKLKMSGKSLDKDSIEMLKNIKKHN
jgi:predicted HD superfamily hydrolase involved in NAD metabolism